LNTASRLLAEWLERAEKLWQQYGKGKISLSGRPDKFHGLSAQQPISKLRVAYSASGTIPAAAILRDQMAIVEHKLYGRKSRVSAKADT
jgi:hypothetical protein